MELLRINIWLFIVEQDGAEVALNFNNIAKARLVPDYDELMSGQARDA